MHIMDETYLNNIWMNITSLVFFCFCVALHGSMCSDGSLPPSHDLASVISFNSTNTISGSSASGATAMTHSGSSASGEQPQHLGTKVSPGWSFDQFVGQGNSLEIDLSSLCFIESEHNSNRTLFIFW